jgi:hypothetical protein
VGDAGNRRGKHDLHDHHADSTYVGGRPWKPSNENTQGHCR